MNIDVWTRIVSQALQSYFDQKTGGQPRAVPGAPLKPMVMQLAAKENLPYPPPEYANKKFGEFLQALPDAVVTRHRVGQDLLVAPAGRDDLFDGQSEAPKGVLPSTLRTDVFRAFTQIPKQGSSFSYSKQARAFVEHSSGASDDDLLPVGAETMQRALAQRKEFVATLATLGATREALLDAINATEPLAAFSRVIKQQHLEKRWHEFRTKDVLERLRRWAADRGLPYAREWEEPPEVTDPQKISARETNAFLAGLMQLGPEDAKRVLVPLDIVLKVLRRD